MNVAWANKKAYIVCKSNISKWLTSCMTRLIAATQLSADSAESVLIR